MINLTAPIVVPIPLCQILIFRQRSGVKLSKTLSLQQLHEISEACLVDLSEFDEAFVLDCYKGKKLGCSIPRKLRRHGAKAEKGNLQ